MGGLQAGGPTADCTACHFLAGINTESKGIERLRSKLERDREKRKKGKKEEGRSPVVPTGLQCRPETPELTGSWTERPAVGGGCPGLLFPSPPRE